MKEKKAVSIFDFIDYRHFLIELAEKSKERDSDFSYRTIARMAGSSSPNFLQLIRDRKLNISPDAVSMLAESLKLSKREKQYFQTIIRFDHAKTSEEKDQLLQRIISTRHRSISKELRKEHYEYFSHWYMPVVRELVTCSAYPDDPSWIAGRIVPAVSPVKIGKAIGLLQKLSLIRREGKRWILSDQVVKTPSEVLSLAISKYTKEMIKLGKEAVDRFDSGERDLRSVTLGIPTEAYPELKRKMEAFWDEILAFGQKQKDTEQVFQVNMQLFPLSRKKENKK
ncbi:MAG: TIGR02147 family protein [Fibrobacter sp.]|mgnify:CR=1 FL=1|nr:TIGR02147 family protein [Fibrobacter sp.]